MLLQAEDPFDDAFGEVPWPNLQFTDAYTPRVAVAVSSIAFEALKGLEQSPVACKSYGGLLDEFSALVAEADHALIKGLRAD